MSSSSVIVGKCVFCLLKPFLILFPTKSVAHTPQHAWESPGSLANADCWWKTCSLWFGKSRWGGQFAVLNKLQFQVILILMIWGHALIIIVLDNYSSLLKNLPCFLNQGFLQVIFYTLKKPSKTCLKPQIVPYGLWEPSKCRALAQGSVLICTR